MRKDVYSKMWIRIFFVSSQIDILLTLYLKFLTTIEFNSRIRHVIRNMITQKQASLIYYIIWVGSVVTI